MLLRNGKKNLRYACHVFFPKSSEQSQYAFHFEDYLQLHDLDDKSNSNIKWKIILLYILFIIEETTKSKPNQNETKQSIQYNIWQIISAADDEMTEAQ